MFDFDIGKLLVFGIVALAVIPPKDLPRVMRTVGQYVGKMRRMANEFQGQFMQAMKEAELDTVQKEIAAINASAKETFKSANIDASFDPAMAMRNEISSAIEPPKPALAETAAVTELAAAAEAPAGAREPFLSEIVATPPVIPQAPPVEVVPELASPAAEAAPSNAAASPAP